MPWVSRKGDEYRATKITINLDTEEIVLEGSVQGTAAVEEEKPAADEGAPADGAGEPGASVVEPPPEGGTQEETPGAP